MQRKTDLIIVVFIAFIFGRPAFTQTPSQSEIVELKAQIEFLKQRQSDTARMIDALEKKIDAMQPAQTAQPAPAAEGQTPPAVLLRASVAAPPTKTAALQATPPNTQSEAQHRPPIAGPVSDRAPNMQPRDVLSEDRDAVA